MNIIIDYGLGNLASVSRAFKKAGIECAISSDKEEIRNAHSLILPGVGAFRDAIKALREMELIPVIKEQVGKGKYLIGICLGMQLLYEKSYEYGEYEGLGLIEGSVERLDVDLKVPHMGWNNLKFNTELTRPKSPSSKGGGCQRAVKSSMDSTNIQCGLNPPLNEVSFNKQDPILKYINENDYVYFVHSYYIKSTNSELVAYADYGVKVPAIVRKGNVIGFQFHPEKSAQVGANLIKAYGEMIG